MIINVHETLYETLTETFRIFFQKFFLAKQTRLFNCHPAKQDTVRVWATDGRVIMSAMKKKAGVPDFAQWALNRTQATTRPEPQREWIGLLVLFQLGVHAAAACRPSMISRSGPAWQGRAWYRPNRHASFYFPRVFLPVVLFLRTWKELLSDTYWPTRDSSTHKP